jgi:hypothetical protein
MRLPQSHYIDNRYGGLIRFESGNFLTFFNWFFFFKFHPPTLDWLIIEIHNFFLFGFHGVITITWSKLQLWQVNHGWLKLFVFWSFVLSESFFQFYSSILVWLKIRFHNLFWFVFYRIIPVSWSGLWIWQVNLGWLELIQYVFVSIF